MRLRVQIGDADVDVGKKVQKGIVEFRQFRRKQAGALKRVVALLNRVAGSVGYRLVPVEGTPPSAAQPVAPRSGGRAADSPGFRPKPKTKRR